MDTTHEDLEVIRALVRKYCEAKNCVILARIVRLVAEEVWMELDAKHGTSARQELDLSKVERAADELLGVFERAFETPDKSSRVWNF